MEQQISSFLHPHKHKVTFGALLFSCSSLLYILFGFFSYHNNTKYIELWESIVHMRGTCFHMDLFCGWDNLALVRVELACGVSVYPWMVLKYSFYGTTLTITLKKCFLPAFSLCIKLLTSWLSRELKVPWVGIQSPSFIHQ